ncbi:MAG TPA: trimethylamine methyltransferase family protein [Anaerovoracaceae bacterium]|nr:trimethylamine methyltransferase family protein [Anaerovoracaceae bacterium]
MRSNFVSKQSVQYRVWDDGQCAAVVNSVFRVLERTGCLVHHKKALELLKDAGCSVDGERVRFPSSLMQWAVNSAPSTFALYDRFGKPAMKLEPYVSNFGPTMGDTFILDHETGEKRRGVKADVVNAALVMEACANLSYASGLTIISDAEPAISEVHEVHTILPILTKPIIYWAQNIDNLRDMVEMFEAVAGSPEKLAEKPTSFCLVCPVDPLVHTDNGITQIMYLAEKRLPMVYIPGISFGCTGPITMAGNVVIGVANTLVGLLVSQLTRKGTPFIASKFTDNMDMASGMISHSLPELFLVNAASADVFRYLGIPSMLNMGGTDAGVFSQGYVFDVAMGYYTAVLSGSNINWGLGSMEAGNSSSLLDLVFGNEVLSFINAVTDGIEVSPYTLAEDVIDSVGPGGNFFGEAQTAKHMREFWKPTVLKSQGYDQWHAGGGKDIDARLKDRVNEIIAKGVQKPLSDDIVKKLDAILGKAKKRVKDNPGAATSGGH